MSELKYLDVIYHHDPDIVEIIFKNKIPAAVDEYAEVVLQYGTNLIEQNKLDKPIYIIVNVNQSGLYSLNYAMTRIKENVIKLKSLPRAYFAYITDNHDDKLIIERFGYLPNSRNKDTRRVFGSHERETLMEWLLSNKEI